MEIGNFRNQNLCRLKMWIAGKLAILIVKFAENFPPYRFIKQHESENLLNIEMKRKMFLNETENLWHSCKSSEAKSIWFSFPFSFAISNVRLESTLRRSMFHRHVCSFL